MFHRLLSFTKGTATVSAVVATAGLLLAASNSPAQEVETDALSERAEEESWRRGRFLIGAGAFFPLHETGVRLNSLRTGQGTEVRFESELGLDETTVDFRIEADLQLGRRHRIGASYFKLNRRATERLGKEIRWGEDTLFVGLNVDSAWKLTTLDINYRFALFQKRKWDLGLVAGFYVAAFEGGLVAQETDLGTIEKYTLPLPLFGADLQFYPSRRIIIMGTFQYFSLSIDEFYGKIVDTRAFVAYRVSKRFSVGLGYDFFDITLEDNEKIRILDVVQPMVRWGVKYEYRGPAIIAGFTF